MRLSPSELLDRVHHGGGSIILMPDRGLQCENVPSDLVSELRRHAANDVLQSVLSGECFRPKPEQEPEKAERKPSSRPRRTCQICKTGTGCRRRMAVKEYELCPICQHWCASHYPREVSFGGVERSSGGCMGWVGRDFAMNRCTCPGWPVAPEPKKKIKSRKKGKDQHDSPSKCVF
jgi:hypothetical protein